MFKIHDDKVYFVAETPNINKVIEIFLPKDDRGTIMDSHEIRVDLCRAVIHMEKKGVRVLKVRNIEDTNKASIDIWHMPEYQEAAESPVSDVVNACIESCFDSGAMFNLPCKANRKTHEVFAVECCASPDDDDSFSYAEVKINGKDYPINFIDDIAETRNGLTKEIARIMRQMDRSRRAMNPQYFNENGTVKRLKRKNGHKQIRHWNYSKNYYRLLYRLRDLNRKLAAVRKTEHYILANEMLTYGNEFVVEDMNYKALQKRNKKTKINPKTGRAHSKKRFGKSIGRCAPALFITILGQKASRCGGSVIKVSTFETKASQFDHTDDSFTKKKLSQRFAKLSDGTVVQRDLYSAFLLLHLRKNLQSYNKKTIKKDFPQFKMLHDKTKERLQNSHEWLPCSVGF